jgi:hypothetical protein
MRLFLTTLQSAGEAVTTAHVTEVLVQSVLCASSEAATNNQECRGRSYSEVRFFSKHIDSGIDERLFHPACLHNTTRWTQAAVSPMLLQKAAAVGALPERHGAWRTSW